MPKTKISLFSKVWTFLEILLVNHPTKAVSECSWTTLSCLKAFSRTIISQEQLINLMLLTIYNEWLDIFELIAIASAFNDGND